MSLFWALLMTAVLQYCHAGIHLQNPRGSGNRLDESGRSRSNRMRLFDSQANDRQGYNVGSLYYLQGSVLEVEWTNQHSCNNPNANCEIILQYMCEDSVRDGVLRGTIPDRLDRCENNNCNTDRRFSMHEDYDYYKECRLRSRNKGLFTADLDFRRFTRAVNTRQNIRGRRYGFECPEERDYYPYWHPTPWKDIAIMLNDVERCELYTSQSENVLGRGYCKISKALLEEFGTRITIPNNEIDCNAFKWPKNSAEGEGERGEWIVVPSHGIPAPICQQTDYTRDNHNGNGINGKTNRFFWTIPEDLHEKCILRIRYNVTSDDYDGWETTAEQNGIINKLDEGARVPLYSNLGKTSRCDIGDRGYYFKRFPEVQVFEGLDLHFRLAIDTNRMGKTFEDRSFTFAIRERPDYIPADANIYNLNVRGKRGNIVETYPSTEYDFVPTDLVMYPNDYYHVQWTGSNSNNGGNDGQGTRGTDRSNMVFLTDQVYPEGNGYFGPGVKVGHFGNNYPRTYHNSTYSEEYLQILSNLAFLTPGQLGGKMFQLDDAGTYFDMGPLQAPEPGTYSYMCSRNNAFTNRDQKGRLFVKDSEPQKRKLNSDITKLLSILESEI